MRISDHIGKNSDGDVQIIITEDDQYVSYNIHDQKLRVITYEKAKKVIQSLKILNEVVTPKGLINTYKSQITSLTQKCASYKKQLKQ